MLFDALNDRLEIKLPLTQPTGLARVKQRKSVSEIGKPVATRSTPLTSDCYIEWQIAYDTLEENYSNSKIAFDRVRSTDNNRQNKYLYELSDYLYLAIELNLISKTVLRELLDF